MSLLSLSEEDKKISQIFFHCSSLVNALESINNDDNADYYRDVVLPFVYESIKWWIWNDLITEEEMNKLAEQINSEISNNKIGYVDSYEPSKFIISSVKKQSLIFYNYIWQLIQKF